MHSKQTHSRHELRHLSALVLALAAAVPLARAQPAPPVSPVPVTNYEYDAQGNPTKTIQAPGVSGFGFATQATYDTLNRPKNTTNAKTGVTQFGYDGRENLTQVTDPRSLITQYPRNGLGDASSLVSPDTGTATLTYDAAGNVKTRTSSLGVLATNTYDALNRLTQTVFSQSGQTNLTYSWTYDQTGTGYANGIGRLTSTTHPAGSTQYTYDPQGRVLTDIQRVGAVTGANTATITKTVTYTYDSAGNITSILYPSGRKLVLTYTNGQLSSLALGKDAVTTPVDLITQLQFSPFGGPLSWNWQMTSGAVADGRVYDTAGRLVRYPLGGFIRDLTYDAADRITAYTHYDAATGTATTAATALNQSFGYDELGRLTTVTTATASWTIGYDANGNRTGATLNGTTSTYTTEATSNRLTSITNPARSFGYDTAGNTLSDSTSYTAVYSMANRMRTLTKAGVTSTYSYDGMQRRVRKFDSSGAASTVIFVYDQAGQLLGEYNSSGTVLREYVWLGSTPVAIFTPDTVAANPPLVYYVYTDHLDTPRVVVNKSNGLRWRWIAEPFGTTAPETNPASLGVFTQNLRFPGQYADQESGLIYNWNRNYDSSIGRYVQSDPIGLAGGVNTYAYVNGNPLMYMDPMGLYSFSEFVDDSANFSAGWGDMLSFGITARIRDGFDIGSVNKCSAFYKGGEAFGFANGLALGWAQGTKAAAKAASANNWSNFSHSLVPHSAMKGSSNPVVRWMDSVGNRLNGDYIPAGARPDLHDLMDAVAARTGGNYATWPAWRRLMNRMPYVPGSAAYGAASAGMNECGCD